MLGDKLVSLRRASGLSQAAVADALGVSRQTISNWELGQGAPALDKAALLAELYQVTLDDLVSDRVEVVSAATSADDAADLHVLHALKGALAVLTIDDGALFLDVGTKPVRILDVNNTWIRISYERRQETVVQLVDLNAIVGFDVLEEGAA